MKNNERVFVEQIKQGILSIDSQGRIWRNRRWINYRNGYRRLDVLERAEAMNNGYLELTNRSNGKLVRAKASRIVWIYFHGDIDDDLQINHINGDRSDNHPDNIELVTASENTQHAYRIGAAHGRPGEKHHNAKLSWKDVARIKELYKPRHGQGKPITNEPRYSQTGLARMFNVSQGQIGRILRGERWKTR